MYSVPLCLASLALTTAAAIDVLGGGTQPTLIAGAGRGAPGSDVVYRTTPTGEATDDTKAPNLHHYEGVTWRSRGDAEADVVVVFTHTTIEPSSVLSFYSLFYGWEPPFYAVALDQPGDMIGPFQTEGVPCNSGGMATCTPTEQPDVTDCSSAYLEGYLQYLHRALTHIRQGHSKLVLAGLSFGGVLFEDYIRWRSNMGDDEAVNGLILISNPTSELWPDHFGASICNCGADTQLADASWFAEFFNYNMVCIAFQPSGYYDRMIQEANFIDGNDEIPNVAEQSIKAKELQQRYFDSVNRNITGWKEEMFSLSLIANSPNETTMELFTTAPNMTIPGLRWGAHAYEVKAKLPKLILYARTELNGTTYYAWEPLQKDVQAKCTLEALNCTLSYVDVVDDNWKRAVFFDWANPLQPLESVESPDDVHIWGHWVHVVAPHMMREKVEEWMATAPL